MPSQAFNQHFEQNFRPVAERQARIAELDRQAEQLYKLRRETCGHLRRQCYQVQIDAIERELAALIDPRIGILVRDGRQVFYATKRSRQVEFSTLAGARRYLKAN